MKKIKLFLAFVFSTMLIQSCSENDLELTNPEQLSPETFFKTEPQVASAVNAVYANLQTLGLYTRHMYFMMDNMSHENMIAIHLEADKKEYYNFSFTATHGAIHEYWNSCFRGINKANFVIENQEKIDAIPESFLSSDRKAKYIGEAKFLRAFYYFLLVTRYGDVPLITTIPEDATGFPRAPKADVYQQIIADLQDAQASLLDTDDTGRATSGAATAMLGKTYLFMGNKSAAITEFNKIYGEYSLEDEYFNNFMEETEYGPESIFEVAYDDDMGGGAVWNSGFTGAGPNEVQLRGQEYGFKDWFNVYPSDELIAEFEAGDTRADDSFYFPGDSYGEDGLLTVTAADLVVDGVQASAGWRKYQNYYKDNNEDQQSGINMKVIRYADVLLMMAECVYETNPGLAMDYINEVRQRPSVNLPPVAGLSGQALFDAIVHERMVELAGEQHRFPDLVRWGLADDYLAGTNFEPGKHEIFPIPANEINSNEAITEEDQNPGY